MEVQLVELIEQIKKDGVAAAESQAEEIIAAAKAEAERIVNDAKNQAEKTLENAKTETERMVKSSEDAIRQAGRNLLISFRESIAKQLELITAERVNEVYSAEALSSILVNVIEVWASKPEADDLQIILNSADLEKLEKALLAALRDKMLGGVTLKANDNFIGGFRIAVNNGAVYYDFSAEAAIDMLSNYLSPKVTQLLKEAQ